MVVYIERAGKIHITRRLRGIHAAWHFWFAVSFVVKVVCGKLV
ncbi:DUF3265 domain-containing protein [Vibrio vulnificus]|nr:DUF3265 domain-containing protein [Vibrio vulnificus]